jgi:hypothetical protein
MTMRFAAAEMERLSGCLARLMPYVRRDEIAITGGVAIRLSLAGHPDSRATIADLDFVASCVDVVADSVSRTFLISHYHVPQPDVPKFMIQLVDPPSRMRIDIFPDLVGSLKRGKRFIIGDQSVIVLSLQSILDHKLLTVSKASESAPVDPKHDRDARALAAILGREIPPAPAGGLVKDVYGMEEDVACRRCELSQNPGFPLAAKHRIRDLLGWRHAQEPTGSGIAGRQTIEVGLISGDSKTRRRPPPREATPGRAP